MLSTYTEKNKHWQFPVDSWHSFGIVLHNIGQCTECSSMNNAVNEGGWSKFSLEIVWNALSPLYAVATTTPLWNDFRSIPEIFSSIVFFRSSSFLSILLKNETDTFLAVLDTWCHVFVFQNCINASHSKMLATAKWAWISVAVYVCKYVWNILHKKCHFFSVSPLTHSVITSIPFPASSLPTLFSLVCYARICVLRTVMWHFLWRKMENEKRTVTQRQRIPYQERIQFMCVVKCVNGCVLWVYVHMYSYRWNMVNRCDKITWIAN